MFEKEEIKFDDLANLSGTANIKVIGVGGAGCNAVNRMIAENVQGVDFWVINTDAQVLAVSKARNRIVLGKELTKGLGAGADPIRGREASIESEAEIKEALKGADLVFIAAGMGGGTGTGGAPIIAKIAKDLGALVIGIVTRPFTFEGLTRIENAAEGIRELKENVDALIVVSNDKLLEVIGGISLREAFKEADKVLRQGVQTITDLIAVPSLINLDFADVRTIMQEKGYALIGIGMGKGENKAEEAALKAISSPLLEASITGAKDAIVNVTGGDSMTLFEANAAVDIVRQQAGNDINIIFGVAINENLTDEMIVTVIATGFDESTIVYANPNIIQQRRQEWRNNIKEGTKPRRAGDTAHYATNHASPLAQTRAASFAFNAGMNGTSNLRNPLPTSNPGNTLTGESNYSGVSLTGEIEVEDEIPSFLKHR